MRLAIDFERYRQLRWVLGGVLLTIALIPAAAWFGGRPGGGDGAQAAPHPPLSITASGRIQPKDGVITIAAPTFNAGPSIVRTLDVAQGEWVKAGQLLATLSGKDEIEAALAGAERRVAVARLRLAALKAGGKAEDVNALRAEVRSEEANLAQAQADTRRTRELFASHVVASAVLEAQQTRVEMASRSLDARRARLQALSSARPADIAVAEAELAAAAADVGETRARLEHTLVRAPAEGRVLAIYAHPGQNVGMDGLLAFGRTSEMFVDAEVVEEDLPRARRGQRARITGDVLPAAVEGVVDEVGYLVGSRETFKTDPTAFADSRVVHVKVRALHPEQLDRFINARVTVVIDP